MFHEACAQIEIDELRDYQKALQVNICLLSSAATGHCSWQFNTATNPATEVAQAFGSAYYLSHTSSLSHDA